MSSIQMASLVLKTSDLADNATNQYGTINQYKTAYTWNNINLRTVLGDLYDKFDTFNLCLNTVVSSTGDANLGAATDDRTVIIKMSGLPFINQTYSVKQGCNTNVCALCSFTFFRSSTATQYFNSSNCYTFGKSANMVNLTIQYGTILADKIPATAVAFPHMVYLFDIVGVEPSKATTQQKISG